MKTLKRLNDKPSHFLTEGMCPNCQQTINEFDLTKMATFRRLFLNQLGASRADSGEEAIEMAQLGLQLRQDKPEIDIEDAQYKLLKKYCERNQINWAAHFQAQVLTLLKDSEKTIG